MQRSCCAPDINTIGWTKIRIQVYSKNQITIFSNYHIRESIAIRKRDVVIPMPHLEKATARSRELTAGPTIACNLKQSSRLIETTILFVSFYSFVRSCRLLALSSAFVPTVNRHVQTRACTSPVPTAGSPIKQVGMIHEFLLNCALQPPSTLVPAVIHVRYGIQKPQRRPLSFDISSIFQFFALHSFRVFLIIYTFTPC